VAEEIEYEEFDAGAAGAAAPTAAGGPSGAPDISRLSEIPMELSVEIGRTRTTVGETLELRVGSVVALGRQAGEPVDLLVNGSPIARGEVVVVDERYGLRITEILDGSQERSLTAAAEAGAAGEEPQLDGEPAEAAGAGA
jgi:flagellar motor switch protein FliN/FliY